jgi:CheY-like chemotaxis protein
MRKRILVVEDDTQQRSVLENFLKGEKFYVETAVDGLDAVQRARLGWFDVILMDYRLPEVDGLAAARLIGDLTRDHGSPRIIALTACAAEVLQREAAPPKVFFAVEPKPWNPISLLARIDEANPAAGLPPEAESSWPPPRAAPDRAPGRHLRKVSRILLVDDDDLPRAMLCTVLSSRGYQVDEAADGLQAVLMMGDEPYDAAILDFGLPKVNGVAAARLVRDLLAQAERPRLIALTANPTLVHDKEDGFASVFDEIIPKTAGLEAVIDAIEACLAAPLPAVHGPQNTWTGTKTGPNEAGQI